MKDQMPEVLDSVIASFPKEVQGYWYRNPHNPCYSIVAYNDTVVVKRPIYPWISYEQIRDTAADAVEECLVQSTPLMKFLNGIDK